LQGSLSREPFPEVLHALARSEQSGVLQLTRDLTSKRIYFGGGAIVFARSNQHSERLGEFLVERGRITRSHLADASNKLRASGQMLGAVLVRMGLLNEDEVREQVSEQIRSMIRPLFVWNGGEYCFRTEGDLVARDLQVDLPTIPTILDGTRSVEDMQSIIRVLGSLERVVSYSRDPWIHSHHVSLTPREGFVLSRVDGQSSMANIVSITPMEEVETLRCLYTLVSAGFIEFGAKSRDLTPSRKSAALFEIRLSTRPDQESPSATAAERAARADILAKHAQLASATFYDVLGVRRNARVDEIRKAYLEQVRRYHPDRNASPALSDLQPMLQEILARVTEAHEVLRVPAARKGHDQALKIEAPRGEKEAAPIEAPVVTPPTAGETRAARYYQEARAAFDKGDFHDAVRLLEEVVQLDSGKAPYHRLLAQSLERNPKWRREAEDHYRRAIKLDPFDVESMRRLADLYDAAGMRLRATSLYQMALELSPDDWELKARLRGRI
jgi:tetratricopeptide (TPR) repeat protein